MDREQEKVRRRRRRDDRQRMLRRARKVVRQWWGCRPVEPELVVRVRDIEWSAVRVADNLRVCSCWMCKSERKVGKGDSRLTMQERKFKDASVAQWQSASLPSWL